MSGQGFFRTLSAIGYGVNGVAKGLKDAADQKQTEEDRAYLRDQRARQQKLQGEEDTLRASMKTAAAPAAVEPVDIPAEGPVEPGAAPPMKQGYMVNGNVVGNEMARDKAVSAYSAPDAVMARMAGAQTAAGRSDLAMETTHKAAQAKLTGMQLDEAQLKAVDTAYDRDVRSRGATWDGLGDIISESKGDGQGGALKGKFVPSANGKQITFNALGADGSMTPTPYSFENTPQGLLTAQSTLSRLTTPEQKLTHLHQQAQEQQATAQLAETTRHNRASEGNTAERIAMMQTVAEIKGELRGRGAGSGALTMADLKDGHKTIASTLNGDYKTQIDNEPDPVKVKAIKTARESEIDAVQRVYTGAMTAGMALTPEQAVAAFRTGEIGKQTFKTKDGSTTTVDVLRVDGRLIPMSASPGIGAPAGQTPKPAGKEDAGKTGVKTDGKGGTKPEGPGLLARMAESPIVKRLSDLGADYTSETGKAELAKRVSDAGKGGAPLSKVETLRAKQAGLI